MYAGRRFWDATDDQGDRSIDAQPNLLYHSLIPFCTILECRAHVHVKVGSNQLTHQRTSCTTNCGTIPNRPEFSPPSLKISHECIKMHRFNLHSSRLNHLTHAWWNPPWKTQSPQVQLEIINYMNHDGWNLCVHYITFLNVDRPSSSSASIRSIATTLKMHQFHTSLGSSSFNHSTHTSTWNPA